MDKIEKTLVAGGGGCPADRNCLWPLCSGFNEEAVERVYELKRRPRDKALNLNVASIEDDLCFF